MIAYVLDPNLQPLPEPNDVTNTDELKAERKKQAKDEVMSWEHILNTLSDRLYDLYNSIDTPKEIWTALEYKHKAEKEGTNKFFILKYFEFTMVETKQVIDHIHELQIMVTKLRELKKKLLQRRDDISLEELQKHLRIEEETRSSNQKNVPHDFSKINIVEGSNRKRKNNNTNNKFKKISSNKKIFSVNCFHCGKKDHRISDCKFRKKK
ncbi:hypothetical protein UlMin_003659 [Ulmus minor]